MDKEKKESLKNALYKKALGYEISDTIEEFALDENNEMKLTKKKITTKFMPQDTTAVKTLMEFYDESENEFLNISDDELEAERQRLLTELLNYGKKQKKEDK